MTASTRGAATPGTAPGGVCLTLDETAAVATAPPGLSGALYTHFRGGGVRCRLVRGAGLRDVIDFGDPGPADERRIRALFAAWRAGEDGRDSVESPCHYVWVGLAVVILWLLALFAC